MSKRKKNKLEQLILLCTPRRCGSGLIRDYLVGNGIPMKELPHFGVNSAADIAQALNAQPEPIQGIKPVVLDMLHKEIEPASEWFCNLLAKVKTERVVWVYLDRRNHVRQAMSLIRSSQIGEGGVFEGTPQQADIPYPYKRLPRRIRIMDMERVWWSAFFDSYCIEPTIIYYEDLIADIPGTIRKVFDLLGIKNPNLNCKARIKQSGEDVEPHIQQFYRTVLNWKGGLTWENND
jgi:hypothetical protein